MVPPNARPVPQIRGASLYPRIVAIVADEVAIAKAMVVCPEKNERLSSEGLAVSSRIALGARGKKWTNGRSRAKANFATWFSTPAMTVASAIRRASIGKYFADPAWFAAKAV